MKLTFQAEDTYTSEMVTAGETLIITCGLNNVFFVNKLGPQGERIVSCRGRWQDEHTFIEEQNFDLSSEIQFFTVTSTFKGKEVSIKVDSSMGYFPSLQAIGEMID
jgi:hypothetical protein